MKRFTDAEIKTLVGIGFCQPKFYKPSIWSKAKKLMLLACELNLGVIHRPIRGAGHFWIEGDATIQQVTDALVEKYGGVA